MGQPKLVSTQPNTWWPVSIASRAIFSSIALVLVVASCLTLALLCASLAESTKAISSTP